MLDSQPKNEKTSFAYRAEKPDVSDDLTVNFAVACVDLAGTVLEVIPLEEENITVNDDGSWSITVPLEPAVNCLVIANLSQPLDLKVGDSINDSDNLYAPASAESIRISPLSTAAFNNLVEELGGSGTFEDANIDPRDPAQINAVDNVMTNIAALLANQSFSESTLAELLDAIAAIIAPFIEQEINNIQNPVVTTAAELIREGGGMYFISSNRWQEILYTAFAGDTASYSYYKDGEFVSRDTHRERAYILSSSGWVEASGVDELSSYNVDGSVTYVDSKADGFKTFINLTQGFNLAGVNIADILLANENTTLLHEKVQSEAVFSEGAVGYRVSINHPLSYSVLLNTGEANGTCYFVDGMLPEHANGNCNQQEIRKDANIFERPAITIESMLSAEVGINAVGSRALPSGAVGDYRLDIQMINNSSKTVTYYAREWEGSSADAYIVGTGNWTEFTLPNLSENSRAIRFDYPKSVLAVANIWSQGNYQAFVVQDEFVRHLLVDPPKVHPGGVLVFNQVAKEDIMNALKKID